MSLCMLFGRSSIFIVFLVKYNKQVSYNFIILFWNCWGQKITLILMYSFKAWSRTDSHLVTMQSSKISTIRGKTIKIVQLLADKLLNGCWYYHLLLLLSEHQEDSSSSYIVGMRVDFLHGFGMKRSFQPDLLAVAVYLSAW